MILLNEAVYFLLHFNRQKNKIKKLELRPLRFRPTLYNLNKIAFLYHHWMFEHKYIILPKREALTLYISRLGLILYRLTQSCRLGRLRYKDDKNVIPIIIYIYIRRPHFIKFVYTEWSMLCYNINKMPI